MFTKEQSGFTLIELLIVVAIIAILAAIAVPNFLEAQVRSKVSRAKADERSAATALEAYLVDYNTYPLPNPDQVNLFFIQYISQLSTPTAYLTTTIFPDPFAVSKTDTGLAYGGGTAGVVTPRSDWKQTLFYWPYHSTAWTTAFFANRRAFGVFTHGPSKWWSGIEHYPAFVEHPELVGVIPWVEVYDASNGTKSMGGIARFGGDLRIQQTP